MKVIGMSLGVHSEVGGCGRCWCIRPGLEHNRLTPSNAEELLRQCSGARTGQVGARRSMQITGRPSRLSSVHSQVDVGPVSRPMRIAPGAFDLT